MEFFAGVANQLGEARFDVHMHVLKLNLPGEFAAFNLAK